jgi:hypothetical protein
MASFQHIFSALQFKQLRNVGIAFNYCLFLEEEKMKKLCLAAILVFICGTTQAVTWQQVDFTNIYGGAVSYDASGDNVVVAGTAFYEKIRSDGYLGTQLNGGDGIDLEVAGNFAMYVTVHYSDAANVLGQVLSNANTMMAYEFRTWGVNLDFNNDGKSDYTESFTLNATDMPGVDYLKATYSEIDKWGYTQIAPGVWMDLALDTANNNAALSIVINGFTGKWGDVNALALPGALQGYTPGVTPGSGIRVMEIPEPATMSILALGALAALRKRK